MQPSLSRPELPLARKLAGWTEGARNRLFRLVGIAHRQTVVELGAGFGCVAEQLASRVPGRVIAVDQDPEPLESLRSRTGGRVEIHCADVHDLPFQDRSADLIVSHFAFLWFSRPQRVVEEIQRVLAPGGAVAIIEPDYGGLMEYPVVGLREAWIRALQHHGADPLIGRKLPTLLANGALDIQVLFCDRYQPPSPDSFQFLQPLLSPSDGASSAAMAGPPPQTIFLPLWLVAGHVRSQ